MGISVCTTPMVLAIHCGNCIAVLAGMKVHSCKRTSFRRSSINRCPPVRNKHLPNTAGRCHLTSPQVYRLVVNTTRRRRMAVVVSRRVLAHTECVSVCAAVHLVVSLKTHTVGQRCVQRVSQSCVHEYPHVCKFYFGLVHTHKYTTHPRQVNPYKYFFVKQILVACWQT
jgi:hypothetical protein